MKFAFRKHTYGYMFTNSQELLFLRREKIVYKQCVCDTAQAPIAPYCASVGEFRGGLPFHSAENSRGLHQNQLPLLSLLIKAGLWPK